MGAANTEPATPSEPPSSAHPAEDIGSAETAVASSERSEERDRGADGSGFAPGQRIGRFTVLERLGHGGMGIVVSAYDPKLDRRVAIKLLSAKAAGESEHRNRLVREAQAMAKLRHPNVVSVYEVGEHRGQVYLAMEQVDGGTLRRAIAESEGDGASHWRDIVNLFIQAGRGLAAAHAQGMVHRDFKPDNVFVDASGRVLVGDFGLVGPMEAVPSESGDSAELRAPFTRAARVVGTPAYMAPEQHRAEAVDARADQFAFCVALYEALFGELPFEGERRRDYVTAIERGEVKTPPRAKKVPS